MKKTLTLTAGIMLSAFIGAGAIAETSPNAATPQSPAPVREPQNSQTESTPAVQGKTGLSKRNKAKLEQEEQRKMRVEEIQKGRAGEAVLQP